MEVGSVINKNMMHELNFAATNCHFQFCWVGMVPGFFKLKLTADVTTAKNWHMWISLKDLGKVYRSSVDIIRFLMLIS